MCFLFNKNCRNICHLTKQHKVHENIYILIIYLMLTLEIISTYRNLHNILIQNGVLDGTHLGKYWSYRHIKYIGY